MNERLTVLILGGYGTFGGRLVRLLADEARLTIVIAGHSLKQAEIFCAALPARASLVPAAFDRERDVDAQLGRLAPDTVVDASGPFQGYADPYRVVRRDRAGHPLSRSRGWLGFRKGHQAVRCAGA